MSRTKHVYSSIGELCHIWAHSWRELGHGRNGSGNIFFEGNKIYSYGRHFCIAAMVENDRGETVVLFNPDSYSVSTSRHQREVSRAVNHMQSFAVPIMEPRNNADHLENWTHLRSNLNALRVGFSKAPDSWRFEACERAARDVRAYQQCFNVQGLEEHQIDIQALSPQEMAEAKYKIDAKARTDEIKRLESEAKAEREAAARIEAERIRDLKQSRLELIERLTFGLYKAPRPSWKYGHHAFRNTSEDSAKELARKISSWKRGESGARIPYSYNGPVLMRLRDNVVETSKHASFPVSDCVAIWPLIEQARETGQKLENTGLNMGRFPVSYISETGDVKASCHYVTYSECRKLAIVLGLAEPTTAEVIAHKARKLSKVLSLA